MTAGLPLVLSVAAARSYTGLPRDLLYELAHSGAVASIRRGRHLLLVRSSLETWISNEAARRPA